MQNSLLFDMVLDALDSTMRHLESAWLPQKPNADRFYAHESLPLRLFLGGMDTIGYQPSLLDVGCGSGTKLLLAHYLGWKGLAGIDRHEPYVEVAKAMCPHATIIHADAFDYTEYHRYNVVYSYRLCVDDGEQYRLEHHIVSHMQPGTLAFFPMGVANNLGDYLGDGVWRV